MTTVMVNSHAAEPGCYIAGHWGQYGPDRIADVAESFGWEPGRHVRDDPRRLRRVAEWLDKRTPTEPWRALNVWEFHIEAAADIVTWLNDHTAPMCPHCGGAMYVTSDGFYRHVAFPSEAARQEAGGPCAYSAIDSPIHPVWEWYDGEFCLSLYDGESDEPLDLETLEIA